MATLEELALVHTPVKGDALAHLQRLALSWRLLADLSFADLLLLAPIANEDGHRFVVLAQVRPTTGQTLYVTDLVGHVVDEVERPLVTRAWRRAEETDGEANVLGGKERVRLQCIPVRYRGRVIAIVDPRGAHHLRAPTRVSSSATTSRRSTGSPGWSPRARSRSRARRSSSRVRRASVTA